MKNTSFDKAARGNRRKALWFTLMAHLGLLSGLLLATDTDSNWSQYLPETVKEWIEVKEEVQEPAKAVKKKKANKRA